MASAEPQATVHEQIIEKVCSGIRHIATNGVAPIDSEILKYDNEIYEEAFGFLVWALRSPAGWYALQVMRAELVRQEPVW